MFAVEKLLVVIDTVKQLFWLKIKKIDHQAF